MVIAMLVTAISGNARAAMAIAAMDFVDYVYATGTKLRQSGNIRFEGGCHMSEGNHVRDENC